MTTTVVLSPLRATLLLLSLTAVDVLVVLSLVVMVRQHPRT